MNGPVSLYHLCPAGTAGSVENDSVNFICSEFFIRLACWLGRGPKRGRDLRVYLWLQPLMRVRLTHVEIWLGDCKVGLMREGDNEKEHPSPALRPGAGNWAFPN